MPYGFDNTGPTPISSDAIPVPFTGAHGDDTDEPLNDLTWANASGAAEATFTTPYPGVLRATDDAPEGISGYVTGIPFTELLDGPHFPLLAGLTIKLRVAGQGVALENTPVVGVFYDEAASPVTVNASFSNTGATAITL